MIKQKTLSRSRVQSREAGLSLIELLVGIVVGLLVVFAAIGSLTYTRVASTTVGDSARLQQDAFNAFRIVGHSFRQAGARKLVSNIKGSSQVTFNADFTGLTATASEGRVVDGEDGGGNMPDVVRISHDPGSIIPAGSTTIPSLASTDCLGRAAKALPAVTDLQIRNEFSVLNNQLRCLGSGGIAGQSWAVAEGVEDMQVWFGVRPPFPVNSPLTYQKRDDVDDVNLPFAETILICLRMSGQTASNPTVNTTGCNGEAVAQDGRIRRVFFRVFNIRNVGV